jgi:hypothetical protein
MALFTRPHWEVVYISPYGQPETRLQKRDDKGKRERFGRFGDVCGI